MKRRIFVGKRYRHFKGKMYRVIAIAEHTETREKFVIYEVNKNGQKYRFELVR